MKRAERFCLMVRTVAWKCRWHPRRAGARQADAGFAITGHAHDRDTQRMPVNKGKSWLKLTFATRPWMDEVDCVRNKRLRSHDRQTRTRVLASRSGELRPTIDAGAP